MTPAQPKIVTPLEEKLLRVTRGLVGLSPVEQALPTIGERHPRPTAFTSGAIELVSESLIHGCILFLARAGGWRRERFLRGGKPVDGRLWERTAPAEMPLEFSHHAFEWLVGLTVDAPESAGMDADDADLTPADRLLIFLTHRALRESEYSTAIRSRPIVATNGLVRLAFPGDFTSATADPDFTAWFDGVGSLILEALQGLLAECWTTVEQVKSQLGDWPAVAALGREQERMLSAFVAAAQAAQRPDLIRFIMEAASAVLQPHTTLDLFMGNLPGIGLIRLGDRLAVMRNAIALPRQLLGIRDWERQARAIGYFDEGYAAAQLLLSDWERFDGDTLAQRAETIAREAEPLTVAATESHPIPRAELESAT